MADVLCANHKILQIPPYVFACCSRRPVYVDGWNNEVGFLVLRISQGVGPLTNSTVLMLKAVDLVGHYSIVVLLSRSVRTCI